MNKQIKLTVKEYADKYGTTKQAVYNKINRGTLKIELLNGLKYIVENESKPFNNIVESSNNIEISKITIENLEKENKLLKNTIEELKQDKIKLEKEKEEFKYQVKDKDFEIKSLLEKMENLNDRVIGLIEWKSKSWIQKLFNK